jgi:hypothetical protein
MKSTSIEHEINENPEPSNGSDVKQQVLHLTVEMSTLTTQKIQ